MPGAYRVSGEIVRLELDELDKVQGRPSVIKRLRDHHHLIARLIAEGKRTMEVAEIVGISVSRVSILKGDPAFQQLVEMYRMNYNSIRDTAFADAYKKAALLREVAIDEKLDRYEEDPTSLSNTEINQDIAMTNEMLDGKHTTNTTVSVRLPLADLSEQRRLRAERLSALALPSAKPEPDRPAHSAPARED